VLRAGGVRAANRRRGLDLGRAIRGHVPRVPGYQDRAVNRGRARAAYDPWRDAENTPITVGCRVQQIGIAKEHGAFRPRLHQQGVVISLGGQGGRGFRLRVLFDGDTEPATIRPHLVRVVNP
jgi:hypothetical protein